MSEKLVPTEADRERAERIATAMGLPFTATEIAAGEADMCSLVQEITAHAAAARAEERERFDEIDLYRIIKRSGAKKRIDIARAVLAAIRAGASA